MVGPFDPEKREKRFRYDPEGFGQRSGGRDPVPDALQHLSPSSLKALHDQFFISARSADVEGVRNGLQAGLPPGQREPQTQATALHLAAATGARSIVRLLSERADVDFLARDAHGRLPSELATLFGRDDVLARYLRRKEVLQARADDIDLAVERRVHRRTARAGT